MNKSLLGSISNIVMGQAPPGSECNKEGVGTPFVKAGEFTSHYPLLREWTTQPLKMASEGDVLVCVVGATAGKICLGVNCAIGRSVAAIRPDPSRLSTSYLYHFLQTQTLSLRIISQGLAQGVITLEMLERTAIPLPPLEKQRRIAAILDKADALRQKRRAALQKLDSLTQSLFLDMFGDPAANPNGWQKVPFSELLENIDSGNSPICLDRPAAIDEWGVLKLGAVTKCEFDEREQKALPQTVRIQPELEVKSGDLLFSRKNTRDLVAACALVRQTRPRLLLPDLIFRFVLRDNAPIEKEFLHQLLIFPSKRKDIQKLAGGSAGSMPNISKYNLMRICIEIPPIKLQKQFGAHVNKIQNLRICVSGGAAASEAVFTSLKHRAFRGEL